MFKRLFRINKDACIIGDNCTIKGNVNQVIGNSDNDCCCDKREKTIKSNEEIYKQTLQLADEFYQMMGNISRPNFKYHDSNHATERLVWEMACLAQELLTNSEVEIFE